MSTMSDTMFAFDFVMTYKYTFDNQHGLILTEYIHCIVLEHIDKFDGETPTKIKVNQIHNLEAYCFSQNYDGFTERVLKTEDLEFVTNWKFKS